MRVHRKRDSRRTSGLKRAIGVAGGVSALGKLIGLTPQAVSAWKQVPLERVPEVSAKTGVPSHELRPDYFASNQVVRVPDTLLPVLSS
jgi:DNA-binding transcriptional regulator YdaS (Cro superfamily)